MNTKVARFNFLYLTFNAFFHALPATQYMMVYIHTTQCIGVYYTRRNVHWVHNIHSVYTNTQHIAWYYGALHWSVVQCNACGFSQLHRSALGWMGVHTYSALQDISLGAWGVSKRTMAVPLHCIVLHGSTLHWVHVASLTHSRNFLLPTQQRCTLSFSNTRWWSSWPPSQS